MSNIAKDELLKLAVRISKEMENEAFVAKARKRFEEKNTPPSQQLMDEFEVLQAETFTEWGYNGEDVLRQLKLAVKTYPEPDTHMAISQLCHVEESVLNILGREVAQRFGVSMPEHGGHGHSHNGKPCDGSSHGHNHGAHSHGSHGHSHNGVPCHGHGHGAPNPQQMELMKGAMESLSPQQKADMEALQKKMMTGQPPTADDKKKMAAIQQHIVAYVTMMQNLMQTTVAAAAPAQAKN